MTLAPVTETRLVSLLFTSALALLLLAAWSRPAEAGNRYSDCGGVGQRGCCAFPEFRLPSCDTGLVEYIGGPGAGQGPLSCSIGTCYTASFPAQCGREGQRACTIFEFIPACQSGLVQQLYSGTSYCRRIGADGFPTHCGATGQRPCVITEHIPSCKPNNFEYPLGVQCVALVNGYPSFCGSDGQPPCTLDLQVQLGITSCRPGLVEVGFPAGTCRAIDPDGYPSSCGGDLEPACTIDLQVLLGITSCKPGLLESPSVGGTCFSIDVDGYPAGCGDLDEPPCDIAIQILRGIKSCKSPRVELIEAGTLRQYCGICPPGDIRCLNGGEYDFDRPTPQVWPADEAAPGPRTIFLIHGLGSNRSAYGRNVGDLAAVLDDPRIDHTVYAVDYNAGNVEGPQPLRLFRLERASAADVDGQWGNGRWVLAYTHPGKALNGENFTLFEVAQFLADAIQAVPTADNIALVAHSLGGIVARHVVYRHYDELRNAGKRIAEVATVGSPHVGGGFGVPLVLGGGLVQEIFGCVGAELITDPGLRRMTWQLCQLERWHNGRAAVADLGFTIDDLEFPQIRWATIAGSGYQLELMGLQIPGLDSDTVVSTYSAFGIVADKCYPHSTSEHPDYPGFNGPVPRLIADLDGLPAVTADCYQPDEAGNPDYPHVTRLLAPNGTARDHGGILVDHNSVCFVKSVVAGGLYEADEDGDGVLYCRDNCTMAANPDQLDSDGDGFGNRCDADLTNNGGIVNFADFAAFRAAFGTTSNPAADLNGSGGIVNFADVALFRAMFGQSAGPSGVAP